MFVSLSTLSTENRADVAESAAVAMLTIFVEQALKIARFDFTLIGKQCKQSVLIALSCHRTQCLSSYVNTITVVKKLNQHGLQHCIGYQCMKK
jgi:hypothetical protein